MNSVNIDAPPGARMIRFRKNWIHPIGPAGTRREGTPRPLRGRLLPLIAAFAGIAVSFGASRTVQAEDWMFRRSYYSHEIPEPLRDRFPRPESRSAYRRATIGGRGFAVRSGHRFNRIILQSGLSTDVMIIREDWTRFRP